MAKKSKNRYDLREKLGEGGMGVVWRAHDTILNTDVALKMLLDVTDPQALKLFYEECEKQVSLVHPNLVEIRDMGEFDDNGVRKPFLVMPLLRGKTLTELIRSSRTRLPTERCIDIFTQACRGLQAAHDCGLIHRDIKPSNIFILEDDSVKIIDFGVAHRLDISRTVGRKGTLLYMSPEQVLMKPLSRASDVFSLAVVCYETLTGKQPFLGASEDAIADAIVHATPTPVSALNKDVNSTLSQVIHKALAKQPAFRFSTAKEFGDCLRRAFYNEPLSMFDPAKFAPRLQKASEAFEQGDLPLAQEIVGELESEGHLSTQLQELSENVKATVQKRNIDQLLESARTRVRDGEYRLALQRVFEALQLDSRNAEALALRHDIESRRAEADITEWLKVARQHLEKFSFSHARQAAQRVLEVTPNESRALQFLSEVERKATEFERIREEKGQIYAAAIEAQRRNDISSALSKMKQVLELDKRAPEINEPGRSAAFQSLYNKLHSEHEAINASYGEAKRAYERGDHAAAAALCDRFLKLYPQHTLFKALKFDNDQRWRRAISAKIIEVEENAEREPDLDARVAMLENVVRENPDVPEFARLLKATREKRDLVNEIVNRARDFADRSQYSEALAQWETLQTIHPVFPGLSFEIENVRQRRQLADQIARKNEWIAQINRSVEEGALEDALRLVQLARDEFRQDGELGELEKQIRQQQESANRAKELIRAGKESLERGDFQEALQSLRQAYEIGAKGTFAKTELVGGLLSAARAAQQDPPQARALLQEILEIDPGNQAATGMLRFLNEQLEHRQVDQLISQARQLQTSGDLVGAIKLLDEAPYPRNARLQEMLRELDRNRSEVRSRDLELVRRKRLEADQLNDPPSVYKYIDEVERIAGRYADDVEFKRESHLIRERLRTIVGDQSEQPVVTKHEPRAREQRPREPRRLTNKRAAWIVGGGVFAVLFLVGVFLSRPGTNDPVQQTAGPVTQVGTTVIRSSPPGALILRGGKELGRANPELVVELPSGSAKLEAKLEGYHSESQTILVESGSRKEVNFALVPAKQVLLVQALGAISVDGQPAQQIRDGQFTTQLDPGEHRVRIFIRPGSEASFRVNASDGSAAQVLEPPRASSATLLIVSAADGQARLYSSSSLKLQVDGNALGTVDGRGLQIPLDARSHVIQVGEGVDFRTKTIETGAGRVLVAILETDSNVGSLVVETSEDGAQLELLSGGKSIRKTVITDRHVQLPNLPVGVYLVRVYKDGLDAPPDQTVTLAKGQESRLSFQLRKTPQLVSLRVHSVAGAEILVDGGPVGVTGPDGMLILPGVTAGPHRVEARLRGRRSAQDITLSENEAANRPLEMKLDKGPSIVTLTLNPSNSTVTVARSDGSLSQVSGNRFELPEGRYRFTARAPGYSDRSESVDLEAERIVNIDLTLTQSKPPTLVPGVPSLQGWDPPSAWALDRDGKGIVHRKSGVSLYSAHPIRGTFAFSAQLGNRGHLGFGRSKIEWVVGYANDENYLLFSVQSGRFDSFVIRDGKRQEHSEKVPLPKADEYEIQVRIQDSQILTSFKDGGVWKPLETWKDPIPGVDQGWFGFKDQVLLHTFGFYK